MEEFDPTIKKNSDKYAGTKVFERITGKAAFKDYGVLMEAYEMKVMEKVFILGQIATLEKKNEQIS